MQFLQWLENTAFGQFIASSAWANLVLLCLHAVGMGVVVGILWMLDLRVLGFPKGLPLATFRPLMRLAWLGFLVNATSGILMFSGAATRFIINTDFQLKMLLILLGGISVLVLQRSLALAARDCAGGEILDAPPGLKILAAFSLLFWLGVILFGRQIAYTLARPAA
ncbi:MAG TPA: hypothetical protein VMD56_05750 [Steroidobacteraceae bacterium]|nr:hypothetical protein [Steroidobacteraceae bacterium]